MATTHPPPSRADVSTHPYPSPDDKSYQDGARPADKPSPVLASQADHPSHVLAAPADSAYQRRLAGLEKARAVRAANRAKEQTSMPQTNGTTHVADEPTAPPILQPEPERLPDVDYVFQDTPAAYVATPPQAVQFVPSVGLLRKFFPKYQPRGVYYDVAIRLRDRIMGGTPADPNVMEGWLRKMALGIDKEEEIRAIAIQTVRELGADLSADPTWEEVEAASAKLAETKQTNMFRRHPDLGCYVEGRIVKAMLKENVNIVFGKDRWGKTNKGAKAYLAERVFVDPDVIPLENGRADIHKANGTHLFIGHVTGPQGRQSTLTYYEYVVQPTLRFTIQVFEDCLTDEMWGPLWESAQNNGQGSLRSQGFGRFDLIQWDGPHPVKADR